MPILVEVKRGEILHSKKRQIRFWVIDESRFKRDVIDHLIRATSEQVVKYLIDYGVNKPPSNRNGTVDRLQGFHSHQAKDEKY